MTPQRILVTGGAGFIGSHTVDLLLEQGKQVVVLDNLSSGHMENLNLAHPDLELVEGDVLEYPLLIDLMANCDAVLHLAAIASVPATLKDPIYSFQINTQGVLHVLEAARRLKRSLRVVYASSAAVYGGDTPLPCNDELPLTADLLSPYALQKKQAEEYANLYARLFGVKSLGLRYFNVYGPRQDPNSPYSGVISRFLSAYQAGSVLTIFGDGQQSRDFIHVADVALANTLALSSAYTGVLNIATGVSETLLQLISYLEKKGKQPAKRQLEPAQQGDITASYGTTRLAQEQLNFRYSMPLEKGVIRLMGYTSV